MLLMQVDASGLKDINKLKNNESIFFKNFGGIFQSSKLRFWKIFFIRFLNDFSADFSCSDKQS